MASPSPRRLPSVAPLVVGAALLTSLVGLVRLAEALAEDPALSVLPAGPPDLAPLLVTLLVGRVALSLLPPGLPGEHGTGAHTDGGGLPATLAASLLLGVALVPVQTWLHRTAGLPAGAVALALPWLLPLALRLATLPGDMVPRHGLGVPGPTGAVDRALLVLTTALALLPVAALLLLEVPALPWSLGTLGGPLLPSPTDDPLVSLACLPALVVLVQHGLGALGPPTWLRRAAGLVLVTTPVVLATGLAAGGALGVGTLAAAPELTHLVPALPRAALAAGGATALALPALARADRRAALLAVVGFLSLAWLAPVTLPAAGPALSLAGLASLLLAAPGGLRARLGPPLGVALFLAGAIGLLLLAPVPPPAGTPDPILTPLAGLEALLDGYAPARFGLVLALVDAAWVLALLRRPWRALPERPGGGPGRHPRPALLFLFACAALGLLATLMVRLLLEQAHPWLAPRLVGATPELLQLLLPGGLLLLVAVLTEAAAGRAR